MRPAIVVIVVPSRHGVDPIRVVADELASPPVAPVLVSGTARPPFAKWGLWVAGIAAGLWLAREAATPVD